jgi:hypothetical protein
MANGDAPVTASEVQSTILTALKDHGFAAIVALACLYVGRQDVLLPLVKAHTAFLEQLSGTQREIAQAVQEQTRLLYALQPRQAGQPPAVANPKE